jgi:hypothetical protein
MSEREDLGAGIYAALSAFVRILKTLDSCDVLVSVIAMPIQSWDNTYDH